MPMDGSRFPEGLDVQQLMLKDFDNATNQICLSQLI